jgi:hypothetical protein
MGRAFLFPVHAQDHDLCYQPLCHNCTHLATIFKYEASKMLFQRQKLMAVHTVIDTDFKQVFFV